MPYNDLSAKVAELADAPDLGSGPARGGGSNPPFRTTCVSQLFAAAHRRPVLNRRLSFAAGSRILADLLPNPAGRRSERSVIPTLLDKDDSSGIVRGLAELKITPFQSDDSQRRPACADYVRHQFPQEDRTAHAAKKADGFFRARAARCRKCLQEETAGAFVF